METEVSPLSSRGSLVSKISVVLDEEEDDAFTEMLADDVLTEEEELLAEIDELLLYREGNLTDDSGIGSSQETVRSDGVSETSLQKRETVKSAKWTLPKIPKIPFSQYLGSK